MSTPFSLLESYLPTVFLLLFSLIGGAILSSSMRSRAFADNLPRCDVSKKEYLIEIEDCTRLQVGIIARFPGILLYCEADSDLILNGKRLHRRGMMRNLHITDDFVMYDVVNKYGVAEYSVARSSTPD